MKEVCEVIRRHSEFKSDLGERLNGSSMVAFRVRILALTLKGENFVVNSAVSDQEIEEFFNHSHFIQPSLDRAHLISGGSSNLRRGVCCAQ